MKSRKLLHIVFLTVLTLVFLILIIRLYRNPETTEKREKPGISESAPALPSMEKRVLSI